MLEKLARWRFVLVLTTVEKLTRWRFVLVFRLCELESFKALADP
jgi:hypothetical protein